MPWMWIDREPGRSCMARRGGCDSGDIVGQVSSATWSPDFEVNVAIGMVDKKFWGSNSNLFIDYSENDRREIYIQEKFWS